MIPMPRLQCVIDGFIAAPDCGYGFCWRSYRDWGFSVGLCRRDCHRAYRSCGRPCDLDRRDPGVFGNGISTKRPIEIGICGRRWWMVRVTESVIWTWADSYPNDDRSGLGQLHGRLEDLRPTGVQEDRT